MSKSSSSSSASAQRLPVRKTYKLYIGGAFPRSESGRSYPVTAPSGEVVHAAQASRKDVRDAVVAARAAFGKWSTMTAYNRGQILYRIAEMLEGRREQFVAYSSAAEVDAAIDRWVHYAGWADKYTQIVGGTNPVAGPYFNFSLPEPSGVVGVLAPQDSSLLGLVSVLAPVLTTGNTAVVITSQDLPLPAMSLAEVLGTSDLPGGVVNLLTGLTAELAPWLAAHRDVNAIDLTGAAPGLRAELQAAAADNVKRVYVPR
jgi:acyl-CoA reductase-like NAD-dependent aldehyde dehydrogenase